MLLFAGNSNVELSKQIASELGIKLGNLTVDKFSDGECAIEILDNVCGEDTYILQSLCFPTNDNLVELLLILDTLRRSAAGRITVICPYFGYARQDQLDSDRQVPVSAKVISSLIESAGITRILTMELHSERVLNFFKISAINICGLPIFLKDMNRLLGQKITIVAPDAGAIPRAKFFARSIQGAKLVIIDKVRVQPNQIQAMNLIGDVAGSNCLIVDDMVDTARTLCNAADLVISGGAISVVAYCIHPILSGSAIERINNSQLAELVVTDTIPLLHTAKLCRKIRVLSVAGVFAEILRS